jgi:hypothetical protein
MFCFSSVSLVSNTCIFAEVLHGLLVFSCFLRFAGKIRIIAVVLEVLFTFSPLMRFAGILKSHSRSGFKRFACRLCIIVEVLQCWDSN